MQAKSFIVALFALGTAASAFAQPAATPASTSVEAYPVAAAEAPGTVTRAQVMAEFYAARKAGQIPQTEADFDIAQTTHHVVKLRTAK